MELHEALSQIAEIRSRVAATQQFRGYRAAPVAATGVLAAVAAVTQPIIAPHPADDLPAYLYLWLTAAALGLVAAGVRIALEDWSAPHAITRQLTRLAVGQFAPCVAAGGLLTLVVGRHATALGWALPGLWQMVFALGVFASCRLLPKPTVWVGVWYLLAGTVCLAYGQGPLAYHPLAMGLPFAAGQLATAGILYWHLERSHGRHAD